MAFNGSGTFVRLYNWANDKAANIKVRADRMDNEMDGMATGLSTCIAKDGQTTITANLPMANFRHTGVGNASARTDYAAAGQVQDGKLNWVDSGGTADAITATYSPAITALVDGQICYVRAGAANTSTTPTFAPNGLTARTITKNGNQALVAGDIYGDSHELILRYRLSDTKWELLNPVYSFVPDLAPFVDSTAIIKGSSDDTKLLRVEVDGITTGTTRVWTAPDADLTVVGEDTAQTLTNKTIDFDSNTVQNIPSSPLYGHISGFLPSSITGSSTTASMTISAGQATDSTNAFSITKATSSSWAVSNGNAALGYQGGTTLPNSDTIHLFACYGSSGATIFAHNGLTPTLPSGYDDYYRRIGSFNTNGSGAPIAYTAIELNGGGYDVTLTTATAQTYTGSTSGALLTLSGIPADIRVKPKIVATAGTSSTNGIITTEEETSAAPAQNGTAPGVNFINDGGQNVGFPDVITNTSGQVRQRTSSTDSYYIYCHGWVDFRR